MAIVTFLQAKAYGKPLVLCRSCSPHLPAIRADLPRDAVLASPATSPVAAVGVRAYSQTTGVWLRGIMHDEYGIAPEQIRWVTFEGRMSPRRASQPGSSAPRRERSSSPWLRDGELDAIIGRQRRAGRTRRSVGLPRPRGLGRGLLGEHRFVPVNHHRHHPARSVERDPGLATRARPPLPRRRRSLRLPPTDATPIP